MSAKETASYTHNFPAPAQLPDNNDKLEEAMGDAGQYVIAMLVANKRDMPADEKLTNCLMAMSYLSDCIYGLQATQIVDVDADLTGILKKDERYANSPDLTKHLTRED